ncbi:MAG: fucose isomerase, partial [Clostridium sp.]|nr:fucose isomerase [Clostridium sp.]
VTIFRIGRKPDGKFRFFIAGGAAMDKPKQFQGTSVVVKTDSSAKDVVYGSVKDGWEPHYVVVYADVAAELEKLARMFGAEICRY